jgi:hypothetical protein
MGPVNLDGLQVHLGMQNLTGLACNSGAQESLELGKEQDRADIGTDQKQTNQGHDEFNRGFHCRGPL